MKKLIEIPAPSAAQVTAYLRKWDALETYRAQESSLRKLFRRTYPDNSDLDDVLIKVCALNDFYSTNIYAPFVVAQHIVALGIDPALAQQDMALVNEIARVQVKPDRHINFYSFATKYCSHHAPTAYPIYDSYIEKILVHFKKKDHFHAFKRADLKQYSAFKKSLLAFSAFYGLGAFDLKQIDKYLWQLGKEYFPRRY